VIAYYNNSYDLVKFGSLLEGTKKYLVYFFHFFQNIGVGGGMLKTGEVLFQTIFVNLLAVLTAILIIFEMEYYLTVTMHSI
jgi:hypothetical protein